MAGIYCRIGIDKSSKRKIIRRERGKSRRIILNIGRRNIAPRDSTLELKKLAKGSDTPLQGAEFTLIPDANPNKARSVTTDKDGNATVDNLLSGNYHLIETKAPAGYDIDPAYAGEGKEIQLAFKDDSQPLTYTVYNSKHVLPRTGGIGQAIALLLGSLLLSLAIALITWRMKRQVG